MADEIAGISVVIGVDMTQFQKSMQKAVATMDNAANKMQSIGKTLSVSVTAPLLLFGKSAIDAAATLEAVQSKFDVVFGDMGESTRQWAAQMAESLGRGQGDIERFLSSIQDLLVPMGVAPDHARDMSKAVSQLAIDLASFNGISDDDALRALQSALVGNGETMKQFGVILNETTTNAELLRMGIEGGTKAATNAEKAQARLNIIIRGSSAALGDASATSGQFLNQVKRLQARFGDFLENIGGILLPMATRAVNKLSEAFKNLAAIDPDKMKLGVAIASIAAAAGPALIAISNMTKAVRSLSGAFTLLNSSLGIVLSAIVGITIQVFLVVTAWQTLIQTFPVLSEFFNGLVDWLSSVINTMKEFVNSIIATANELLNTAIPLLEEIGDAIGEAFDGSVADELFTNFTKNAEKNFELLKNTASIAASDIQNSLIKMFDVEGLAGGQRDTSVYDGFGDAAGGVNSMAGATDRLNSSQTELNKTLENTNKSLLSFVPIMSSQQIAIKNAQKAQKAYAEQVQFTQSIVSSLASTFVNELFAAFEGTKTGVEAMQSAVKSALRTVVNSLINAAIAAIVAGEAINKSALGVAAVGAALAAGAVAAGAFGGLKMAEGGIATQPTQALIGENPASAGEAVLPLEDIAGLTAPQVDMGKAMSEMSFRIQGNDLVTAIERNGQSKSRVQGTAINIG